MAQEFCTYPRCKCIVQTSTSQPSPICPKELPQAPINISELRDKLREEIAASGGC